MLGFGVLGHKVLIIEHEKVLVSALIYQADFFQIVRVILNVLRHEL